MCVHVYVCTCVLYVLCIQHTTYMLVCCVFIFLIVPCYASAGLRFMTQVHDPVIQTMGDVSFTTKPCTSHVQA